MTPNTTLPHVRWNVVMNIIDAGFFGLGMGMSSFVAVIPLFVATLTDSTLLIGVISAAHMIGWQLPQLVTAGMVTRRARLLPLVLFMTLQERWPYFVMALAALALGLGLIDKTLAFWMTFIMVWLHSLGGGFTATAWQSMIYKIMPPHIRGTFYGFQSSAANLMASVGAIVVAGTLLAVLPYPINFALCFGLTGISMMISLGFLARTKEPLLEAAGKRSDKPGAFWRRVRRILREDPNFRYFVLARMLGQAAQAVTGFYALYAVREHGMSTATAAGIMAGVLTIAQMMASPLIGRLGDMYGHRLMFILSNGCMAVSALLALAAHDVNSFLIVFILAGVVNGGQWTTMLAISSEFGDDASRPYYIGLSHSSVAPITLLAPILGGALIDSLGFDATFGAAIVLAGLSIAVLLLLVQEPRHVRLPASHAPAAGD